MEQNCTLSKKPSISDLGSVMNIVLQIHIEDALLKLIHSSAKNLVIFLQRNFLTFLS